MHFVWNHDRKTSIQYHVTRENIQQTCSSSCIALQHCVGAHMNAHKHTQRINEQHEGVDPRKKNTSEEYIRSQHYDGFAVRIAISHPRSRNRA